MKDRQQMADWGATGWAVHLAARDLGAKGTAGDRADPTMLQERKGLMAGRAGRA